MKTPKYIQKILISRGYTCHYLLECSAIKGLRFLGVDENRGSEYIPFVNYLNHIPREQMIELYHVHRKSYYDNS